MAVFLLCCSLANFSLFSFALLALVSCLLFSLPLGPFVVASFSGFTDSDRITSPGSSSSPRNKAYLFVVPTLYICSIPPCFFSDCNGFLLPWLSLSKSGHLHSAQTHTHGTIFDRIIIYTNGRKLHI